VPVIWEETHEVTSMDANGINVRVSYSGDVVSGSRTEVLATAGIVKVGALMDIETRDFRRRCSATPFR
jgi:hypothetical protein